MVNSRAGAVHAALTEQHMHTRTQSYSASSMGKYKPMVCPFIVHTCHALSIAAYTAAAVCTRLANLNAIAIGDVYEHTCSSSTSSGSLTPSSLGRGHCCTVAQGKLCTKSFADFDSRPRVAMSCTVVAQVSHLVPALSLLCLFSCLLPLQLPSFSFFIPRGPPQASFHSNRDSFNQLTGGDICFLHGHVCLRKHGKCPKVPVDTAHLHHDEHNAPPPTPCFCAAIFGVTRRNRSEDHAK